MKFSSQISDRLSKIKNWMCKYFFFIFEDHCINLNLIYFAIFKVIVFFQPFNATRINAAAIEDRVKVLQKENKSVSGKAGFYEEFEVSMANYRRSIFLPVTVLCLFTVSDHLAFLFF